MKRFFKFCGTLVLILVLIGIAFVGVSYFTTGPESITKMVSDFTDGKVNLSWSGVNVNLSGMDIDLGKVLENNSRYAIGDQNMFDKDYTIWEKSVAKTQIDGATDESITNLNMELGGCEFVLEASEDDCFYFEYDGTGKSQAYEKDGKLYVKVLNTVAWTVNSNSGTVILYVPNEIALGTVEVSLGAGEMELDGLKAEKLVFELGAGQVHATGLQADHMVVSLGAGDIKLAKATLKDVEAEVGAGNFEIEGAVSGNISAQCAMGNITLKLDGNENDFNYEIECMTGNITIGKHEYSGLAQEQSINNNASKSIDLECAMGNVEVSFK